MRKIVYPCIPQFDYMKVRFKGVHVLISWTFFLILTHANSTFNKPGSLYNLVCYNKVLDTTQTILGFCMLHVVSKQVFTSYCGLFSPVLVVVSHIGCLRIVKVKLQNVTKMQTLLFSFPFLSFTQLLYCVCWFTIRRSTLQCSYHSLFVRDWITFTPMSTAILTY